MAAAILALFSKLSPEFLSAQLLVMRGRVRRGQLLDGLPSTSTSIIIRTSNQPGRAHNGPGARLASRGNLLEHAALPGCTDTLNYSPNRSIDGFALYCTNRMNISVY